ncbi:MAG: hypothetical protein ACJ8FZ_12590 [Bradyrhizobium sp.]
MAGKTRKSLHSIGPAPHVVLNEHRTILSIFKQQRTAHIAVQTKAKEDHRDRRGVLATGSVVSREFVRQFGATPIDYGKARV